MPYLSSSQNTLIKSLLLVAFFIFIPKISIAMLKTERAGLQAKLFRIYTEDFGIYEYVAEDHIKAMCNYLAYQKYTTIKNALSLKEILHGALMQGAVRIKGCSYLYAQFDGYIDFFVGTLSGKWYTLSAETTEDFAFKTLISIYTNL